MKRLCSVCARAGSKGVKNKNLRPLLDRPLIVHTIEQALASGIFDEVAVSSDSEDILRVALDAGATRTIVRPPALATDFIDKSPAIVHCGREVEKLTGISFDTFVDLDATAPLRTPEHIRQAVKLLETSGASNVYSACPSHRSPYFNLVELGRDGVPRLVKNCDPPVVRRQDAPPTFDLNASIYAWRRDAFFESGAAVHMDQTGLFVMPESTVFDIDRELDFALVEFLLPQMSRLPV